MAALKTMKNKMRRAKRKEQKKGHAEFVSKNPDTKHKIKPEGTKPSEENTDGEIEAEKESGVVIMTEFDGPGELAFEIDDERFAAFKDILSKFGVSLDEDEIAKEANAGHQGEVLWDDDDIPSEEEEVTGQTKLSKKKRKQLNKLSIAELKALVKIPDVVEWQDTSSSDPRLLVQIKAQRNVVPVPGHWQLKREYLSSKRGIEKPPFKLPMFIAETGITEMRDAVLEKQEQQSLKQKQRERVAPKVGKLDIDYQKLYDAFFRFQTKPELTRFGEVYYEGKETEVDFQHFRPGELTEATKEALGMPLGAPPPWLINQQRFGPPPSYPSLKTPGLNAPPPPGGSWGFHPGGWGKPPVDEFNRPLYGGDVFGLTNQAGAQVMPPVAQPQGAGEPVEKTLWGELQPRDEESEEEESEDESEDEALVEGTAGGLESPSGIETSGGMVSSVPTDYPGHGIETSVAGELDLRKHRRGFDTEESSHPRSAYHVIPERHQRTEGFFGSDRVYDLNLQKVANGESNMPVLGQDDDDRKRKKPCDVDVTLDPDALQTHDSIHKDELRRLFEEGKREAGIGAKWAYEEDLSEMIAQESRKRQKIEERRGEEKKKQSKYRF